MTELSKFEIYITEPYFRIGRIYCVLTGTKFDDLTVEAEWFYYLKDKDKKMKYGRLSFTGAENIEEVWNNHIIEQLIHVITEDEIKPIFEKRNDYSMYKKVELKKLEKEELIYLSTENIEFIEYLKKHTNCCELKKLVDVLPIIRITKPDIK